MNDEAWIDVVDLNYEEEKRLAKQEGPNMRGRLTQAVYDYLDKDQGPNFRAVGFHASELYKICPRRDLLRYWFPKDLEVMAEEPRKWAQAEFMLTVMYGTWVNDGMQNGVLARMKYLWGEWRCTRCWKTVTGTYAPTNPCPSCGWAVKGPCSNTCIWPGGFAARGRNCLRCLRWGSWRYVEPMVHNPEYDLIGSADGLLRFPDEPNALYLLEMKTKTKPLFDILRRPDEGHRVQVQVYANELKKRLPELKGIVIWYIHKGEYRGGDTPKEFWLELDDTLVQAGYRRIHKIQKIRSNPEGQELSRHQPERMCPSKDSSVAKRCPWFRECYDRKIEQRVERIARLRMPPEVGGEHAARREAD